MSSELYASDLAAYQSVYCANTADQAPLFTAEVVLNGQIEKMSLSDYLGKWVLLFFYPSDFTFVWPTELAAVAAIYQRLQALNTEVIAISTDSVFSHKVFLETSPLLKNVHYPLMSDRNHDICRAYRVLDERTGASLRASFFLDPDQIIAAKLIYPREVGRNLDEHVRIIEGLHYVSKTGKGVPANWVPGQSGITRDPKKIGRI